MMYAKTNVADFERQMAMAMLLTHRETEAHVKRTAASILEKIIDRMPVLTGRARGGWTDAARALGVELPPPPIEAASLPGDSEYRESWQGTRFEVVMINRVPYIVYLEFGGSPKAPAGMARISIEEVANDRTLDQEYLDRVAAVWRTLSMSERYAQHAGVFRTVMG
jgi:hypothetical protein